jgi:hypothetical protein
MHAYFVKRLCALKVHLDKQRGEDAVSDDPTCWICFANTRCAPVHLGCRCPKTVHLACAAKWYIKSIRCCWRGNVLDDDWIHDYESSCEVCQRPHDKWCVHFFVDVLHSIKGMRTRTEQEKKDAFYACMLALDCDACGAPPPPRVKKAVFVCKNTRLLGLAPVVIALVLLNLFVLFVHLVFAFRHM